MDSELTLVNPTPPTPYFLSSTSLKDEVIYANPTIPLYKITTEVRHITVSDTATPGRTIAILHRRDLLPDTISFPQRHSDSGKGRGIATHVGLHRWLKRSKMPDGTPTYALHTDFGKYVWKVVSRYRQQVFADYDLQTPVASCHLRQSLPPDKPAFVVAFAGEPLRDDIVVAYFVQRYRAAMENKALELFVGPA
ncbi:hypothetical protein JVU11DRAFT_21 [Chiua virens]|nr:hypothetical protein JVU11DRAFT_21 [Chiua virens]